MNSLTVYVAYASDLRSATNLALNTDPGKYAQLAQALERGNKIWREWALGCGGQYYGMISDSAYLSVSADHLGDLPGLLTRFEETIESKTSVGIGKSITEAADALQACLLTSPGKMRLYDDTVTADLADGTEDDVLTKADPGLNTPAAGGGMTGPEEPNTQAAEEPQTEASEHSEGEQMQSLLEDHPLPPPPDLLKEFADLAQQSQGAEQAEQNQQATTQSADALRQQIARTLQDFRGQSETLETLQQSDPELYKTLVEVVQSMISMAKELYGEQPVQKSEVFEKALPKTRAENDANQAASDAFTHPVNQDALLERYGGQVFDPKSQVSLVKDPVDASAPGVGEKMQAVSQANNASLFHQEGNTHDYRNYASENEPEKMWQGVDTQAINHAQPIPFFDAPNNRQFQFQWTVPHDPDKTKPGSDRPFVTVNTADDVGFPAKMMRFAYAGKHLRPQDQYGNWINDSTQAAQAGWHWDHEIYPIAQHLNKYVQRRQPELDDPKAALKSEHLAKSYMGPKHDTVEGFMQGIKTQPNAASKGLFITAHLGHAPFLNALKVHPQGANISRQLWGFVNSRANATAAGAGAKVMAKVALAPQSPHVYQAKQAKKPGATGHFNVILPPGSQVDEGATGSNIPGRQGGRKKIVSPDTGKVKWRSVRAGQVMAPDGTPTSSRHPGGSSSGQ